MQTLIVSVNLNLVSKVDSSVSVHVQAISLGPRPPRFDLPFVFTIVGRLTRSSAPVCYCEHKRKLKTGEAWE